MKSFNRFDVVRRLNDDLSADFYNRYDGKVKRNKCPSMHNSYARNLESQAF